MLVQCHENRMIAEVTGTEQQREQQPCSCWSLTLLLTCFTNAPKSTLFHGLGMTSAIMWQLAKKKNQAEGSCGTFVFSFQLFTVSYETELLMRSQGGDFHVHGSKWTGDPGVVKSSCCRLGSPHFLPRANMRERKAKNRLWLCLLASTSEPALKDKNYLLIQVRSAIS